MKSKQGTTNIWRQFSGTVLALPFSYTYKGMGDKSIVAEEWGIYMNDENGKDLFGKPGHTLAKESEDPFMGLLHKIICVEKMRCKE